MSRRVKSLCWWGVGNLMLLFGLPALTFWYLQREIDEQYRTGVRTSTGGDSLGIPVSEVAIMTVVVLLIINVVAALVWLSMTLWRKWQR